MICQLSPMKRESWRHPSLLGARPKEAGAAPEYFTSALRRARKNKRSEIVSQLLRQQANRRNSRGPHDIDDPGHHGKFDRCIAPDKCSAVSTHREDFSQPG